MDTSDGYPPLAGESLETTPQAGFLSRGWEWNRHSLWAKTVPHISEKLPPPLQFALRGSLQHPRERGKSTRCTAFLTPCR